MTRPAKFPRISAFSGHNFEAVVGDLPGQLLRAWGRPVRSRSQSIRDDYYTGINFAYLLNVRAQLQEGEEATTDRVLARRIRREVLTPCAVEALIGLGNVAESDALKAKMLGKPPPPPKWMVDAHDVATRLPGEAQPLMRRHRSSTLCHIDT